MIWDNDDNDRSDRLAVSAHGWAQSVATAPSPPACGRAAGCYVASIGTVAAQACGVAGCGLLAGLAVAGSVRLSLAGLLTSRCRSFPLPAGCRCGNPIPPRVTLAPDGLFDGVAWPLCRPLALQSPQNIFGAKGRLWASARSLHHTR